jgi:hypothetical protein
VTNIPPVVSDPVIWGKITSYLKEPLFDLPESIDISVRKVAYGRWDPGKKLHGNSTHVLPLIHRLGQFHGRNMLAGVPSLLAVARLQYDYQDLGDLRRDWRNDPPSVVFTNHHLRSGDNLLLKAARLKRL